jgi:hypothetical protein
MKKQTGIWLDYKEANFIELLDGELKQFRKIDSDVDTSKARGGLANRGKAGGLMVGVSEKTFENRRRNEEKNYFTEIIENVRDADEVVIFGPGEAKDLLVNAIKTNPNHFNSNLKAVMTADNMTENQKVAYVKNFFGAN